jgi:hypothetical protein
MKSQLISSVQGRPATILSGMMQSQQAPQLDSYLMGSASLLVCTLRTVRPIIFQLNLLGYLR